MRKLIISLLFVPYLFVFAKEPPANKYDIHWKVGKRSPGQVKASKLSPALDEITTSIIAGAFRVQEKNLSIAQLANKEIIHLEFTYDDVTTLNKSIGAYLHILSYEIDNEELRAEFIEMTKAIVEYNNKHFSLRLLCDKKNCTGEEKDVLTTEIIGDWKAEALMKEIEKLKSEMSKFNVKVINAIRNSK